MFCYTEKLCSGKGTLAKTLRINITSKPIRLIFIKISQHFRLSENSLNLLIIFNKIISKVGDFES